MPDDAPKKTRPRTTIMITIDWPPIARDGGQVYMDGEADGAMAMSGFLPPWINPEETSKQIMERVTELVIESGSEYVRTIEMRSSTHYTNREDGGDA